MKTKSGHKTVLIPTDRDANGLEKHKNNLLYKMVMAKVLENELSEIKFSNCPRKLQRLKKKSRLSAATCVFTFKLHFYDGVSLAFQLQLSLGPKDLVEDL